MQQCDDAFSFAHDCAERGDRDPACARCAPISPGRHVVDGEPAYRLHWRGFERSPRLPRAPAHHEHNQRGQGKLRCALSSRLARLRLSRNSGCGVDHYLLVYANSRCMEARPAYCAQGARHRHRPLANHKRPHRGADCAQLRAAMRSRILRPDTQSHHGHESGI
jgi:hypothetical protein